MFQTRIVISVKAVQLTQTEDQSARMFAVEDICVDEIQTALQETITLNANANKVFTLTEKYAARSNAKMMTIAAMTRDAIIICARLFA